MLRLIAPRHDDDDDDDDDDAAQSAVMPHNVTFRFFTQVGILRRK